MPAGTATDTRTYTCPACGASDGRFLPGVSADALVDYFRCNQCAHIWSLPKARGGMRMISVTPKADRCHLDDAADAERARFLHLLDRPVHIDQRLAGKGR